MKSAKETADELMERLQENPQGTATNKPSKRSMEGEVAFTRMMERFWGKMLGMYAGQWERDYGHIGGSAFLEWRDALSGTDPMRIRHGFEQLKREDDPRETKYPPNLVKFLRLCRQATSAPSHSRAVLLDPPKNKDPGAAERHFNAARALLGDFPPPKERDE
jgi:hypothetical protein